MSTIFRKNEEFNAAESGMAFSLAVLVPYLLTLIVFLLYTAFGGNTARALYRYLTAFAAQLSYLGVILFIFRQKRSWKPFRAGKFGVKYAVLALPICYGMLFGLGYVNDLFVGLLEKAGLSCAPVEVPLGNPSRLVLSLLVFGLMPALFEEMLFRGAILRGTDFMKVWQASLLNGLAFALFHQNPAQFVYPFLTGCVFALVALRAGSALPAAIMHAVNNVTVVLVGYFAPEASFGNVWIVVSALVCLAGALAYLVFFDKKPVYAAEGLEREHPLAGKYFFYFAAAGAVICVVSWISALLG